MLLVARRPESGMCLLGDEVLFWLFNLLPFDWAEPTQAEAALKAKLPAAMRKRWAGFAGESPRRHSQRDSPKSQYLTRLCGSEGWKVDSLNFKDSH